LWQANQKRNLSFSGSFNFQDYEFIGSFSKQNFLLVSDIIVSLLFFVFIFDLANKLKTSFFCEYKLKTVLYPHFSHIVFFQIVLMMREESRM